MSACNTFFAVLLLTSLCKCNRLTWDDLAHNEDYIGKPVPCSAAEKLCFKYGRLLNEDSGKCYPVEERGPCSWPSKFFIDKESLLRTGQFVGKCVRDNQWPEPWFEKYDNGSVVFVGEDCEPGHTIQRNIFGEYVCMCDNCTLKHIEVFQPEKEGYCHVPNFLKYTKIPLVNYWNISGMINYTSCPSKEFYCGYNGQIHWHGDDACHDVGIQDVCEEGHLLLVDEEIFKEENKFVPTCRPQPCPEGQILMQFDRKCHGEEDVVTALCERESLSVNVFGQWGCGKVFLFSPRRLLRVHNDTCEFSPEPEYGGGVISSLPELECSISNIGECPRKVKLPKDYYPVIE